MAQAYVTTYKNHYRHHPLQRTLPFLPDSGPQICDEDKDKYIVIKDFVKGEVDEEEYARAVKAVRQLQKQRLISTYQKDYCKMLSKKSISKEEDELLENEFLEHCSLSYKDKPQHVLPPLPSSRTINGYMRFSRMFTPWTTYQREIGKVGYNILKQHADERAQLHKK